MKKIIYVSLGISLILNVLMMIYIVRNKLSLEVFEQSYRWEVAYQPKIPEGMVLIDGGKYVWIRKDNGRIEICR